MNSIELTLFGGLQVHSSTGSAINIPGRKVALLLAYLALPRGKAHTRDELIGLLWSTRSESQARGSLRHALWSLRKCLGDPSPLEAEGDNIHLSDDVSVDVAMFERLANESSLDALGRAADLYKGELLAGVNPSEAASEEWLFHERERLGELARRTFARLIALQIEARQLDEAADSAHRLLALDRLSEDAHRALMSIYLDRGQRGLALRQFEICRDLLQRELNVTPEAETMRLYERISQGQQSAIADGAAIADRAEDIRPPDPQAPAPETIGAEPAAARPRRMPVIAAAAAAAIFITGIIFYQAEFEDYLAGPIKTEGPSPDQAFWDAIKDSGAVADYAVYLEQFPDGGFTALARSRMATAEAEAAAQTAAMAAQRKSAAEIADQTRTAAEQAQRKAAEIAFWSLIKDSPNRSDFNGYLEKYPEGDFTVLALARLDRIERDRAAAETAAAMRTRRAAEEWALWETIRGTGTPADYKSYLRAYPEGAFAEQAWARLDDIESEALAAETARVMREAAQRLEAEAAARREAEARATEQALWDAIGNSVSASDYVAYLGQYPDGVFSALALARLAEAERRAVAETIEAARRIDAATKLEEARRIAEEVAASNQALTTERTLWQAIENSASAAEYAAYLEQYPNGTFAALVRARIAEIERQAAAVAAEAVRRAEEEAKLKQAEQAAREKIEAAALAAPPEEPLPITEQEILRDEGLKLKIKAFYNSYPIETQRTYGNPLYFKKIMDMKVLSISGNRAQIDLTYRVRGNNKAGGRARALVTVEKTGSSIRVLDLKRWDDVSGGSSSVGIQTAALSPPPDETPPITEQEILTDEALKAAIKDFYDRRPVERHGYSGSAFYFKRIVGMEIFKISGSRAQIDLTYSVGNVGHATKGNARALVTVEKVGSSFRVLDLQRWDGVYGVTGAKQSAGRETQTALLVAPPAPGIVVDKAEVENDDHLKSVIKRYFNALGLLNSNSRRIGIDYFRDLSVKSISGMTFIVEVNYLQSDGSRARKPGSATAEFEKTADSYKIIRFDIIR